MMKTVPTEQIIYVATCSKVNALFFNVHVLSLYIQYVIPFLSATILELHSYTYNFLKQFFLSKMLVYLAGYICFVCILSVTETWHTAEYELADGSSFPRFFEHTELCLWEIYADTDLWCIC